MSVGNRFSRSSPLKLRFSGEAWPISHAHEFPPRMVAMPSSSTERQARPVIVGCAIPSGLLVNYFHYTNNNLSPVDRPDLSTCTPGVVCVLGEVAHQGKECRRLADEEPHIGEKL